MFSFLSFCPFINTLHKRESLCRRGHQLNGDKRVLMGCDIKTGDDDARYDETGCVWGLCASERVFVCVKILFFVKCA